MQRRVWLQEANTGEKNAEWQAATEWVFFSPSKLVSIQVLKIEVTSVNHTFGLDSDSIVVWSLTLTCERDSCWWTNDSREPHNQSS